MLLLLMLVVASRCRRSVSDDRGRLRRDWANRAAIAASAVATVTPVTSMSVTVSMSMVTDRFGLFRRFIPHNPARKKKKNTISRVNYWL